MIVLICWFECSLFFSLDVLGRFFLVYSRKTWSISKKLDAAKLLLATKLARIFVNLRLPSKNKTLERNIEEIWLTLVFSSSSGTLSKEFKQSEALLRNPKVTAQSPFYVLLIIKNALDHFVRTRECDSKFLVSLLFLKKRCKKSKKH